MTEKRFVEVPVGGTPFYESKPEKRFEATYDDGYCVFDNETNQLYHTENEDVAILLAKLMNKQEGDIKQLKQLLKEAQEEIEGYKAMTKINAKVSWGLQDKIKELEPENKQLTLLLKEAEAEIVLLKKSNRELLESLVEEQSED